MERRNFQEQGQKEKKINTSHEPVKQEIIYNKYYFMTFYRILLSMYYIQK